MAFFPQEDSRQLAVLRTKLTPFLKAVSKALSAELKDFKSEQKEYLFDVILQNLPAKNSTPNFCTNLRQASDTLEFEFDQLLNLQ